MSPDQIGLYKLKGFLGERERGESEIDRTELDSDLVVLSSLELFR